MLSEEEDTEADTLPSHYAIVAQCGCGKVYTLLQWFCLPFGWHDHEGIDEYGDTITVEYRHCSCKSTIGIEVDA